MTSVNTSLFELFKIGIGPSSSHTVGPMRAALRFVRELDAAGLLSRRRASRWNLYGSLALTGKGHGTDRAIFLGLMGEAPDTVDPAAVDARIADVRETQWLLLGGRVGISFHEEDDLRFHRDQMYPDAGVATHPNGVRFTAFDGAGAVLATEVYYSIGGGFIVSAEELANPAGAKKREVPYAFRSAAELLRVAETNGLTIAEVVLANEVALLSEPGIVRPRVPEGLTGEAADRGRGACVVRCDDRVHRPRHGDGGHPAWRPEGAAAGSAAGSTVERRRAQRPVRSAGRAGLGHHVGDGR